MKLKLSGVLGFLLVLALHQKLAMSKGQSVNINYIPPGAVQKPPVSRTVFDPASLQMENWPSQHSQQSVVFVRDDNGCPVPSLTTTLAIGQHGPALMQDAFLLNKLAQFNRERIPERVVHAKGHGAFGYFQVTHDISTLTKADFLNGIGKMTPIVARFSTVTGDAGTTDLIGNERGFSVKFYTDDGNFDMAGLTIPMFPIRDPMLFGDLNHSRKRNPQTHLPDMTTKWDFNILRPETILSNLIISSDVGANSRVMSGFGVHAFKFVNRDGIPVYVKLHFLSNQPFTWYNGTELGLVSGKDPDFLTRDLFDAIANRQWPSWTLKIQVMTLEQALKYPVNPFDSTKVWRPEEFPLIPVGQMVLNRNPDNYFNDIEQAAFDPARMVPGIEASPDRLLHGRMFSYPDSQRYRLGINFLQLDVNKPKSPVHNYDRDGFMKGNPNGSGSPNYFPNSFHGPLVNMSVLENIFHVRGTVDRIDTVNDVEDNFRLAKLYLYKDLTKGQRERLAQNLGGEISQAIKPIRERAVKNLFYRVTPEFGKMVEEQMQLALAAQQ